MTANSRFDRDLARWLEADAPVSGPVDLHAAVIEQARSTRQRPGWLVVVRGDAFGTRVGAAGVPSRRIVHLLVILALALAALVAAAIMGGALRSVPAPVHTAGFFIRPFEYVIPRTSTMKPTLESPPLYAFTEGPSEIYPRDSPGSFPPGVRGITVASTKGAVTHPCPLAEGGASRVPIRALPLAFLEDLRTIAGIGVGQATPTTIDGRTGLAVTVTPGASRCDFGDFHVLGGGIGSGYVLMTVPSRLSLVEVDGVTVVIQIWAGTEDDLAAWLPIATEFLDSVHFTPHR